ncbi:2OG-Fe(II) oxygenase superfamily protein [Streptomyces sp. LamerLS-316]|uniref:HalD/BesD family halogenase n=1 Tax=unclassified Streptomyces TaxID=2593676 RepID=UPI000823C57E|nr:MULTISPECIES: arpA protein [unclassified Streptomyces]MYQ38224.1 arpA protein [Streptomyces sp. SID4921]SCK49566.1 2OG-Fe(II) oxygenase superfamily protein [Streptomyces sp. LamerLS-316]
MSTLQAITLDQVVDTDHYPLSDPGHTETRAVVARARRELAEVGCTVLPDFIRPSLQEVLRQECAALAPDAYFDVETVNVYNIDVDADLPEDHPGRRTFERGNAFVARDRIPSDTLIGRLYAHASFQRFVADCFGLPRLYELADPLSGLVLNVVRPGMEHPWHFDTNEYTVSMLTQEAREGGSFEYCPNIRSAEDERFDDVRGVLDGTGARQPERLPLRPGDLQLFKGRYSLHRVSPVRGDRARHSAIFAYSERPGVIGSVSRTRQLFGRVLPEHLAAEGSAVRGDQLLD